MEYEVIDKMPITTMYRVRFLVKNKTCISYSYLMKKLYIGYMCFSMLLSLIRFRVNPCISQSQMSMNERLISCKMLLKLLQWQTLTNRKLMPEKIFLKLKLTWIKCYHLKCKILAEKQVD